MEEVVIRRAVEEDRDAVLAINDNVYDGTDYLGAYYDAFLSSPVATPYVAVYKGEIVGNVTAYMVDDGDTVVTRGGRVKTEVCRRGIYTLLSQHCLESSRARVNAFTTNDTNTAVRSGSIQKTNQLILTKPVTRFDVDAKNIPIETSKTFANITKMTEPNLEHFMTSEKHRAYLFPDNRLIVNWVPYKLMTSNIPIIWNMDKEALRLSDVRFDDGQMYGLMSISTNFFCTGGLLVSQIDIYGTDCGSMKSHIHSHIDFIRETTQGNAILLFHCQSMLLPELENVFENFGIIKTSWKMSDDPDRNVIWTRQYLFEKQLI